ncbi:MAG: ribosomal protein S18-alanine N-acetyltransferase [Lachnospiraceae bacterium]|nr:ribosomal protein S18-alanine N-acetyltransferase [Lachnospiraceae bacterium]
MKLLGEVRPMTAADLEGVARLEAVCFSESWSENLLRSGLDCSLDTYLVYALEGQVVGYCVFRSLGDEGELQRIAVEPESQGQGIARKLMEAMATIARMKGVRQMSLEVRESNRRARNLYESCGFSQEAVRRGYYHNPKEDALIMWNRQI